MASSSSTDLSLHQEQATTGGLKRKQTPNSGAADSDSCSIPTDEDDDAFFDSIKTELFCSLRKKKKKKITLPAGFLAPLSRPSAMEQGEVVAPPRTCGFLRRDVDDSTEDGDDENSDKDYDGDGNSSTPTIVHFTNLPKRGRSKSKWKDIKTCSDNTWQPFNCIAEINVDALQKELPSFVKIMMPSHVGGVFRLKFPRDFCREHLPVENTTITLEDEKEDQYEINYLSICGELGSGWREFATAHKLVEGDILVFQQTNHTNFKVTVNAAPPHHSATALHRAKNLQSSLQPGLLTFLKPILPSYINGVDICLRLPANFYKKYLPGEDATIILEDENDDQYETKYSSSRGELRSGWREFCKAHKLVQGDVLVFQLINQTNFKVYIVRSNLSAEVDAAKSASSGAEKRLVTNDDHLVEFDSCDDLVSNSIESSTSAFDFKNVRGIEDFVIVIDGSVLKDDDSEIPTNIKIKYYDLCRSQRRYLHQNLFKGLNRKLAAGIITEVVNIADAIKANSNTNREIVSEWVKTLSGFKSMGMEVGFLLDWVQKLKEVVEKSEMRIKNARMKRDGAEKEKIELEAKLKVTSEALDQYNGEVKKLEKMQEFILHEVGNVPW